MLQNQITIWCVSPNQVSHTFNVIDTTCVILSPKSYISARICLRKTLRQVKTETISMILLNPVFYDSIHECPRFRGIMIHVIAHIERVSRICIEPRTIRSRLAICCVPIELRHRRLPKLMI